VLIAAGDHPERLRSEAAWAHLCGVARIPVSSGKTVRRRLNPGGDRQANHALWRIVFTRLGSDGADPEDGEQPGGAGGDEGADELIEALELAVEELRAATQLAPSSATRTAAVCPVKRARRSSGPVKIRARAWLMVWVRSPAAAPVGHQRPDCLDRAVAALGPAAGPA
jgi:Transposase IS116/IS110/IS902 family